MFRVKKLTIRQVLLGVVPLLGLLLVVAIYLHGGRYVSTENAYVKADKVPISTEVTGTVARVLVHENEKISAGQPLFDINARPFEVALAKAQAKLALVRTDIAVLRASYIEQQTEVRLAQSRADFAQRELQRLLDVKDRQFVSAASLDQAQQNADIAGQQVIALNQDLRRIAESLGGAVDTPVETHPSFLAAQAELAQAQLDLQRTQVLAPVSGTVIKLPKQGQYLAAGSLAMVIMADGEIWVEANFIETELTFMREGQPVAIRIDSYPGQHWQGIVQSLSPATGAEFAVIPAQNATGNWVKIAQRLPVRIALEVDPSLPILRSGLSAHVEVDTGHKRGFFGITL